MQIFDQAFESSRLNMLAEQYPEVVKTKGEIVFNAEEDEDRLSGTSWTIEDNIYDIIAESGFKSHIIELLDNFIQYRGQCNELPRKEGIIRFGDGFLSIDWLSDGSVKL